MTHEELLEEEAVKRGKWPEVSVDRKQDPLSGEERVWVGLLFLRYENTRRLFNKEYFTRAIHLSPGDAKKLITNLQVAMDGIAEDDFWSRDEARQA